MSWFGRIIFGLALSAPMQGRVVLNFDDLTLADYGVIPANHGVSLDPNLAGVGYRTFTFATGTTLTNYLQLWSSGYGDLTKVAFASSSGFAAELSLVPGAGFGIRLLSFDMAGWLNTDRTNSVMRLVDGSGNLLFDFAAGGPVLIQGDGNGPPHSTFSPNIFSAGTIRFQWGNDWNNGLDNLRFEVVPLSAVPEPSTWVLLVLGGVVLAGRVRRGWAR
ncbi:MAG: PEP-CTERM sorting domain-containing protein [Opitutus sp.]|nr:PEP-CTERM sorting domain-containing protein [Opitutus sp.]